MSEHMFCNGCENTIHASRDKVCAYCSANRLARLLGKYAALMKTASEVLPLLQDNLNLDQDGKVKAFALALSALKESEARDE